MKTRTSFDFILYSLAQDLLDAPKVHVGEWQAQEEVSQSTTFEIDYPVTFGYRYPASITELRTQIHPSLPWAEDHFQERVSGRPYNPPPSAARWPYATDEHKAHIDSGGKFSHTYPERMWPRGPGKGAPLRRLATYGLAGTLDDLVKLLTDRPYTRQAYLPIWYPEDLYQAAVKQERVPCTLGYHFLLRNYTFRVHYFIRSCDFLRHFRDDVYMACRLGQWVATKAQLPVERFDLHMTISSLHIFEGEKEAVRKIANQHDPTQALWQ